MRAPENCTLPASHSRSDNSSILRSTRFFRSEFPVMSSVADAVREEVTTAISKDQLQLPTLPEVALNIRDAAEREDISAHELASVIGGDPSLAARVLKVANSPMYRGAREIETISTAVSRLGIDYTCNLATGLAMQQMFQATSDVVDRKMRAVWAQATQVAAISTVL